ncbi:transporter [Actinoplanes sp. SE50]|nr:MULTISPECIES: MDR family MFS transporter [unclassified Actinoplanes]AEV85848.1 EmrB/QacA family drug resistance transporter [Actinoplanes sp. SE50/110]ATO84244.1 transporter [Actinoplanes sp. SE50]SLM01654.1 transporter [Actinoplanes sp. SE50/110]
MVTMSGLVIAMLLAMLDNMIVAPALPTIVGELHGLNHLAWVTTGYILASTVATPIWGKLGDLLGRRITFLSSIAIFLLGSALCGMSQNMGELVGFRALQGLGAGGLMVGVMAVLADIIPPRERGKYQGVMMAVMPVAMIGGPLVGGFITDHLNWRWAFYVNLPLGVVALGVCWFVLAKLPRGAGAVRIDWLGAALLSVWITALVLITTWGGSQYAWASAQILGLLALAVVAFVAFVVVERRSAEPIMPLSVFANRNFALAGALSLIVGFAMFGGITLLPQFQQYVQGSSATNSGLLLMPMMLSAMVVSLVGGQLITRTGHYRALPILGTVLMTAGLALFATMDIGTSRFTTGLFMAVLGAGMGCLMQTTMLIAQNSAPIQAIGAATGAATFLRNMGGSLGVSLLSTLYTNHLIHALGGGVPTGSAAGMTPAMLRALPDNVRHLFAQAVTDGIGAAFTWGAVAAAAGIVVALFIRHVPLRGFADAPKAPEQAAEELQAV